MAIEGERSNIESINKQMHFLSERRKIMQEVSMEELLGDESGIKDSELYKLNEAISALSKRLRYHTESYCKLQSRYLGFQNRITETRLNFANEYNTWLANGESMLKQYTMALDLDVSLSNAGYQDYKTRENDEELERSKNAVKDHKDSMNDVMESFTVPYVEIVDESDVEEEEGDDKTEA